MDGTLRVIEGYSPLHGRLEICIDEEWSTVCGSGFTDEMAGIACAAMNNSQDGECNGSFMAIDSTCKCTCTCMYNVQNHLMRTP